MAVDAVAFVVLQKLRDLLLEEWFTKNKVIGDQLEQMQEALQKMSGFFMDAANKETNVDQIKKWINDYLLHLYSVEDSIESFALRITRQRKRLGFLMNHALFLKKFKACKMLSRKLKRIQREIVELNGRKPDGLEDASQRGRVPQHMEYSFGSVCEVDEDRDVEQHDDDDDGNGIEEEEEEMRRRNSFSFVDPELTDSPTVSITPEHSFYKMFRRSDGSIIRERFQQSKLMYSYSYNEEELSIIGYKIRVAQLRNRLEDSNDWIISVVGESGSGKTMLARAIYGNRNIKNRFHSACAWANIFKESTTMDILLNLLKQVQKSKEQHASRTSEDLLEVKQRLSDQLKDRRYLIVLDGVWSLDQWRSVKDAFPDQQNGSKIILTTCDEKVADDTMPAKPHFMEMLDSKESWALFLRKVGLAKVPQGSVKKRIIEVCQGLPLNIVLLGSLLSTKNGGREWSDILYNHQRRQTSDIVVLSYNDLDAHLKLCLLYMMLFPKELDIPVRRLQRLWLAEGFVKRPEKEQEKEFPEDVAQGYFENLVKRSLIMVSKLRSDGSPKKCRLLGVLHDHLLANARDISLFHIHRGSDCNEDGQLHKRRLIEYADGKNCKLPSDEYQCLRSYISFNSQKKDTPAKYVDTLVRNMIGKGYGLLRVLDLEGVYKPSLPENLGDLFHLRYLGLRWTFLDKIPKSVGELRYLETLDLKRTNINRIPPSIWKLKHLRHLNLNEIHLDKDTPLHLCNNTLPKLMTLWGLSVNHDSPVNNGLCKFTHLRELGISLRFSKSCDDDTHEGSKNTLPPHQFTQHLLDWISKLTDLRQLRLRSKDDSGCPAHLSLKSFSNLKQLSHMNLLGKLQELPQMDHFPPHIKVLTLSVSHLREDPMPILGQLPDLTVLRLLANSFLGEEMVCKRDTFKNLQVLELWMLNNLKKWEVEEGAMEKLKELNIRKCSKLENIPSKLLQQKTFQDLILNDMPPEFKENVDKFNNQSKISITVKNYGFKDI